MVRLTLAGLCVLALVARLVPRWDAVFPASGLRLADPDGWHHVRLVEQWVRHFPHRMVFDPYMLHPFGGESPTAPLFDGLAATAAWLLGLGAPSETTVHRTVAILPCVLGALTCLPAFALGRRLGGTAGGFVAALAVAFLPGQLFARSMLGFADHHALETLLGATTIACFAAALAEAPPRTPRAAHLAAASLLLYLLNWAGGALLVAALTAATLAVVAADVLRRREAADTFAAFACTAVLALAGVAALSWTLPGARIAAAALAGGVAVTLLAVVVAGTLTRSGVRPGIAAAAAAASLVVGVAAAALATPEIAGTALAATSWFVPTAARVTVAEARPLWLGDSGPSLAPAWSEFGVPGVAALAGLAVLARRVVRDARRDEVLLAVLLAGTVAMSFVQTRFAANGAVAVGALAGAAIGPWLGRAWRGETRDTPAWLGRGVWPVAVAAALVVPTGPFLRVASRTPPTPGEAWEEVLRYLRDETPEPYGDPAAFTALAPRPEPGAAPRPSGYGVLAWWDAGYWITQIARRVPVANPTQAGAGEAARLLLETDPARISARADELGARYVVLDSELPVLPRSDGFQGRLPSVAAWAGRAESSLLRVFRERQEDGGTADVALFLPDYFRSACVRLHTFGGRATPPGGAVALTWEPGGDGTPVVAASRVFPSYEEARAWADAQPGGRTEVGSLSPFVPCVALEETPGFRLAFHSSTAAPAPRIEPLWHLQVWERVSP